MPVGPKGEKRPADLIGCAIMSARLATGELEEETKEKSGKTRSGIAGAKARASKLNPKKRKEIAQKAARARWNKPQK